MGKEQDLRVRRTQQMIKSAFLELMDTIGFNKITVQDIVEKAFINRSTFYLHYQDKYDLLNHLEDGLLDELKNIVEDYYNEILTNGFTNEKVFNIILKVAEYIQDNNQLFYLFFCKNEDHTIMNKFGEILKNIMTQFDIEKRLKIPEKYMIALYEGALTSLIKEWLGSGMEETPYEIAIIYSTIIKDIPQNLVNFD